MGSHRSVGLPCPRGRLRGRSQTHRHQLRDSRFLHGDAIQDGSDAHRFLAVGDEHELVCTLISFTISVKRPMLASSSGASTSSRMQNGLGAYWKIPTSRARAVSAFSPPESSNTFCSFFPGGEATTSIPLSALFSSSVRRMNACPPPKS